MTWRVLNLPTLLVLFLLIQPAAAALRSNAGAKRPDRISFANDIAPLLNKYCSDCHGDGEKKGDFALENFPTEEAVFKARKEWEKLLYNVREHEMPPARKKTQPTQAERDVITGWLEYKFAQIDRHIPPDPGRVTIRRLNRSEYNNTIRDLVGVKFSPADDFPADDVGYGFDNIGDVLSLPPLLLEKYLAAADKILSAAIVTDTQPKRAVSRVEAVKMQGSAGTLRGTFRGVTRDKDLSAQFEFPKEGPYLFRVQAMSRPVGDEPAKMELRVDGQPAGVREVWATADEMGVYEFSATLKPGGKKISFHLTNPFTLPPDKNNTKPRERGFAVETLEILGPPAPVILPETHRRIFTRQPDGRNNLEVAHELIGNFARRAWRRPVTKEEVERLTGFVVRAAKEKETFETGVKLALEAVLVSPRFLFRGELQPEPDNPGSVHPVNEFALASRLSYFLWSSMPDDELLLVAERGRLRKNLEAQVGRMLKDPKSSAFVENFAGQWLQIRGLKSVAPDRKEFPNFDENLRAAMERETELFFESILREDRSVLDIIDADYTFVNERLARHYGIAGVSGDQFQKISLRGTPRAGVLSQAGILTLTSNPTRTSPVKRGKWVLENILGTPPPPPPPNVPELKAGKELTGTLRERMEQHRANPNCASCHARMDPIGFGLENFDAVGAWRDRDGGVAVDASGTLPNGQSFNGPAELRGIFKEKRDLFVHCLGEKMLTYALGRGMESYDRRAIDKISLALARNRYKFSALILEVVKSDPFQLRRGEGQRLSPAATGLP